MKLAKSGSSLKSTTSRQGNDNMLVTRNQFKPSGIVECDQVYRPSNSNVGVMFLKKPIRPFLRHTKYEVGIIFPK